MPPLRLAREGEVLVVRMDDDDNRFHEASLAAWSDALDEVEATTGPAALVLTGTGKFFSNGFDLEGLIERGTIGEAIPGLLALFARLLRLPLYTVAALNGHAFAAGAMLSLAADARVMRADRGYWCLPEADMGVHLAPGMTALIQAKLPPGTAHDAILTARRYGGADAVAAGIVDEAVPEDRVLERAVELAAARAATARDATVKLRTGLYGPLLAVLDAGAVE